MESAPEATVIAALERAAQQFGERPALAHRTDSGWVTTRRTSKRASTRASRLGTAKSGEPMKTTFIAGPLSPRRW